MSYEKMRRSLPPSYYDTYLTLGQEKVLTEGTVFAKDAEGGLFISPAQAQAKLERSYLDLLTHKSPAWCYEREVRMLYDMDALIGGLHHRTVRSSCGPCRAHGLGVDACKTPLYRDAIAIPAEAVRGIIVGTDTPMVAVSDLLSILKEPRYGHVARYWSSHHSEHYALHYSRDDKTDYLAFIQNLRTEQVARAKGHVRHGPNGVTLIPSKKGENYQMDAQQPAD